PLDPLHIVLPAQPRQLHPLLGHSHRILQPDGEHGPTRRLGRQSSQTPSHPSFRYTQSANSGCRAVHAISIRQRRARRSGEFPPLSTEEAADASTLVGQDRKSTRLNSSHVAISYAV